MPRDIPNKVPHSKSLDKHIITINEMTTPKHIPAITESALSMIIVNTLLTVKAKVNFVQKFLHKLIFNCLFLYTIYSERLYPSPRPQPWGRGTLEPLKLYLIQCCTTHRIRSPRNIFVVVLILTSWNNLR